MNNDLGSPLEALALNYLSLEFLTAVNNVWTWVAVLAGAFSFALTVRKPSKPFSPHLNIPDHVPATSPNVPSKTAGHDAKQPKPEPEREPDRDDKATEGTTRKKFMVYIKDDVVDEEVECHVDGGERGWFPDMENELLLEHEPSLSKPRKRMTSGVRIESCASRFGSFADVIAMRVSKGEEMGWYRYQDLTSINGNVVRLWDSCSKKRVSTSSSFVAVTTW